MTESLTTRPARLARATAALYEAIDAAFAAGRTTPCRMSAAYDADDLDVASAADLIEACRNQCPVMQQCSERAVLLTRDEKRGTVTAGVYYPSADKTPQWRDLYDDLRDLIETGHYAVGARLPSVDELARDTQLHRTVIHVALTSLERDGLVVADGADGDRRLVVAYGSIVGARQLSIPDPDATEGTKDGRDLDADDTETGSASRQEVA